MIGFLIRFVIAAAGLWLASEIIPGIDVTNLGSLAAAALLLGLVNAVVRPVIVFLTLPLTMVTLGLFLLVVNAAMIGLVAIFLHGFVVSGFVPAVLAAILTGVTGWIGSVVTKGR